MQGYDLVTPADPASQALWAFRHSAVASPDEDLISPKSERGDRHPQDLLVAHASAGCSICARALVNAREVAVQLTALETTPARPSEGARAALLSRARSLLSGRKPAAERERVLDPSAAVAAKHVASPSEPERTAELDALDALRERPGEGTSRLLAQVARFLDFPVLFVSIVRKDRAIYRAQHGLPEGLAVFRELRREMSFCTHTVSGEAPLVVENAAMEPFFRGNKAVTRFGVLAYAGAPLRMSTGIVAGTLCALDFKARPISRGAVSLLEVFARRAVAEIERERTPALLAAVLEATSDKADIYTEGFFRDAVTAADGHGGASAALVKVRASAASVVLDWIDPDETAGRLGPETFGLLLSDSGAYQERVARLRRIAGNDAVI